MNRSIKAALLSMCLCPIQCLAAPKVNTVSAITTNYRQVTTAGWSISQTFPESIKGIGPITSGLKEAHIRSVANLTMRNREPVLVFGTKESLFYLPKRDLRLNQALPVWRVEPRTPFRGRKSGVNTAEISGKGLRVLRKLIADKDYAAAYARLKAAFDSAPFTFGPYGPMIEELK